MNRRAFLGYSACASAATGLAWPKPTPSLRIGIMDTSLRLAGQAEAVALAAKLGFEGIQVTLGGSRDGVLRFGDGGVQAEYLAALREHRMTLTSTYLDILHRDCLKNQTEAKRWVLEGIDITRKLGAPILMLVFFGKCALANQDELDAVAAALKEAAPAAAKAKVVLGFENTISAVQNLYVLDKVNSPALKVWYDIGNSTGGGFDVPAEIRQLGAERICQFHIKDKGYLGEGKVNVAAAMQAMADVGYRGFGILETSVVGDVAEDARRNLAFARQTWQTVVQGEKNGKEPGRTPA